MDDRCDALLDPRFALFFDWAAVSPVSKPGIAARDAGLSRMDRAEHPARQMLVERARTAGPRAAVAGLLAVTPAQKVVFGHSVTGLLASIATGLAFGGARRRVLLADVEHPAAERAWAGAVRRWSDVDLVPVPPTGGGRIDLDALRRRLDERCVAVCCAHVGRLSGVVQPVREVVALARGVGALSIVDGAQAVGRIPVDVDRLGCDVYLGTGRKALLGPPGVAFAVAGRELLRSLRPVPRALEAEPPDPAVLHGLGGSVEVLSAIGVAAVARHVFALAESMVLRFEDIGVRSLHGGTGMPRAGIATFDLRPHGISGHLIGRSLAEAGIAATSGESFFRLSTHLVNGVREVEAVVEVVRRQLRG